MDAVSFVRQLQDQGPDILARRLAVGHMDGSMEQKWMEMQQIAREALTRARHFPDTGVHLDVLG